MNLGYHNMDNPRKAKRRATSTNCQLSGFFTMNLGYHNMDEKNEAHLYCDEYLSPLQSVLR
jgi:hypothetical protein